MHASSPLRPPVVTVLGHVDHGKTTLLDVIRKTHLAEKEHGGITQHIGAYQAVYNGSKITFIDTPGHEAFARMRERGARVADVAVLVVAANDGVQPQTLESIRHIIASKIPAVVALNKMDLPDLPIQKTKQHLVKAGLSLEEYGGTVPVVPLSAKTGEGVDTLLETILLLFSVGEQKDTHQYKTEGVVIEASVSKQKGILATVVLRQGALSVSQRVSCEGQVFRVRALFSPNGAPIPLCSAGDPVQVLGWERLADVGSILLSSDDVSLPADAAAVRPSVPSSSASPRSRHDASEGVVTCILKADSVGSLEAVCASLHGNVQIIRSGVGAISESDVLLAKTTHAIILGLHVSPSPSIVTLAKSEKVLIKTYSLIYELLDELDDVLDALRAGNLTTELGRATILAVFPYGEKTVAGVKVFSGRIVRGDQVKVLRGEQDIGRSRVASLRHGKEDIHKAEQGEEAGLLFSSDIPFLTGDSIIAIG